MRVEDAIEAVRDEAAECLILFPNCVSYLITPLGSFRFENLAELERGVGHRNASATSAHAAGIYDDICHRVTAAFKVSWEDLFNGSRVEHIMVAKHVARYLCLQSNESSIPAVARYFKRDAGSIIHSRAWCTDRMSVDQKFSSAISVLS